MATGILKKALVLGLVSTGVFAAAGASSGPARAAGDIPKVLSAPLIDEFRLGVLSSDLARNEKGVDLNAEVLFRRPNYYFDNQVLTFLFNPRLHIGASLNTAGETNQAYAGATWDLRLTDRLFIEGSFGGVVHDGKLKPSAVPGAVRPLGCRVMFRESASAGIEMTENLRLMVTLDHISNASLCKYNAGLTTLGARIGYKF